MFENWKQNILKNNVPFVTCIYFGLPFRIMLHHYSVVFTPLIMSFELEIWQKYSILYENDMLTFNSNLFYRGLWKEKCVAVES